MRFTGLKIPIVETEMLEIGLVISRHWGSDQVENPEAKRDRFLRICCQEFDELESALFPPEWPALIVFGYFPVSADL